MNIAYLLTPKHRVAYLYDDNTMRQGLEKLRHHGRSAVPVINRKGQYVGTVSEGDFLWRLLPDEGTPCPCSMKELERLHVRDILRENPSVRITASVDELLGTIVRHNFVPVVDDLNSFIGIVTRQDISVTGPFLRERPLRTFQNSGWLISLPNPRFYGNHRRYYKE